MIRTMPMILRSFSSSLGSLRCSRGGGKRRTDDDLSIRAVLFGSLGLLVLLALYLMHELNQAGDTGAAQKGVLGAFLVLLFGFLFVTVSSRLTREIGSSSNPISGMTTATLMITCLIFLALGMASPRDRLLTLSVARLVCISASNGGTTHPSAPAG